MKKKLLSISMVIVLLLLMQPMTFANAETHKSYKEIIDNTINTYGAFEENINFYATGLIYGEFIDFDNDNTKEMMLIYKKKNDNSYDAPWANIVIYGMKGNTPIKLLEEGIYGSLGQTDVSYQILIRDINGQKHLLFNSKKTPVSHGDSENITMFTMNNKNIEIKKYYGEVLPWWDTYEFKYTKCMIDSKPVSEEEYTGDLYSFYNNSQRINLFLGKDFDNFSFCSKEKLNKFLEEAKNISNTQNTTIAGTLSERYIKDGLGYDVQCLILTLDTPQNFQATDMFGETFTATDVREVQVEAKNYVSGMDGAKIKIASYDEIFEGHTAYHIRPIVVNGAVIEIVEKDITVTLDGKKVIFDQPPIIVEGRTLVPLRAIFEAMGATVNWNDETKTATGHGKQGYDVIVTENSDTAYIDGFPYKLDVPVKNLNGRLLAPARFVAEAFGGYVNWIADSQTVEIQSLSANISDNRSYDENSRYSTCYEAAMTHGRLVYIADGYKSIVLRSGYIDEIGNQYRFVNSPEISDQRYYFDSSNNLVTDYDLSRRLDFVYNVNNNDYKVRSEYWTEKADIEDEMTSLKQSFSKAVALLEEGAASLELGYAAYDVGKIFFDQMVLGTICPPYGKEKLKDIPANFAETTTNLTFDGILLFGLISSKNDFNEYCDTITKTYNKYGYGYITSLEDAEQYISAVSGQYLMIGNADAFAAYLKETYPNMTETEVVKDLGKEIVTGVVGIFVDKVEFKDDFAVGQKLKKLYTGETEIITYLEGINTGGIIAVAKKGTTAFYEAYDIISRLDTFDKTNSKYIELIR